MALPLIAGAGKSHGESHGYAVPVGADESTDHEALLSTRGLCQPSCMYDPLPESLQRYERDCPSSTLLHLQELH